jgi:predicted DNA-binding transcriptional regulator AlpA
VDQTITRGTQSPCGALLQSHNSFVPPRKLRTVPETCAILSIGHSKCWVLIGTGALEVVRLGNRCTRIVESSIDRMIAEGGVK